MQVSRFWTRVGTLAAAVMVQAASAGVVRHVYTGIECGLCCAPHCTVTCSRETEVARAGMVVAAE